ncbi:MAG: sensor histidine kinase [Cellvibrionaceae bacterium]
MTDKRDGILSASGNKTVDVQEERKRLSNAGRLHWFHWAIVTCSLILTFSAWYFTKTQVEQKTQEQFDRQSNQVIELISERMQKYEDALWGGVAAIHSQSFDIDNVEWAAYSEALELELKYPGINGIGVIYYVEKADLPAFLKNERINRPDFKNHPQHTRDIYLPITYIEPVASNAKAVGLDMAHETNRFTAAIKARDTGRAQITGPIVLVQDSEKTPGFLFYAPFYQGGNTKHNSLERRQEQFIGLVYAPFIFKKLLKGTLDENKRSVGLRIKDTDNTLYDELLESNTDYDSKPLFKKTASINIYGREWTFDIWSTQSFRHQTHNSQPRIILAGGIFIDILLLTLFVMLAKSNRYAINFANRLTNSYRIKTQDLESANLELEEFAYRTSHDLRSPITSSIGLLNVATKAIENKKNENAMTSLNYAQNSLETLKTLIDDILTLTKTKNLEEPHEEIDINQMINDSLDAIKYTENFDRLDITKDLQLKTTVYSKRLRVKLIIENLLSNAVKYQDLNKSSSFVKISTAEVGDDFMIEVEDNGLGIPQNLQDQLFSMFKRFHPQISQGSGLGLYMIKKSTAIIEGKITFIDTKDGSKFILKAPREFK